VSTAASIRQQKRQQRRALSPQLQIRHAIQLNRQLVKLAAYRRSKHIACYLANDGEISPHKIIEHAWQQNKTIYLPVLAPLQKTLYFAPYTPHCGLTGNRFNINEPDCHPSKWRRAWQLDLLLLPLVAFDINKNRIGMGGGYYDRTLSYLNRHTLWKKPRLIGLAHETQKSDKLPVQQWDIPLNMVVTDKKIYT